MSVSPGVHTAYKSPVTKIDDGTNCCPYVDNFHETLVSCVYIVSVDPDSGRIVLIITKNYIICTHIYFLINLFNKLKTYAIFGNIFVPLL